MGARAAIDEAQAVRIFFFKPPTAEALWSYMRTLDVGVDLPGEKSHHVVSLRLPELPAWRADKLQHQ